MPDFSVMADFGGRALDPRSGGDEAACIYIDTNIIIAATDINDPRHERAVRLLRGCCNHCKCVVSPVHFLERNADRLLDAIAKARGLGVQMAQLGPERLYEAFEEARRRVPGRRGKGWDRKLLDVLHVAAARVLGCRFIMSADRDIRRLAQQYGLVHINCLTHKGRCPCRARRGRRAKRARARRAAPLATR